MRIKFFIFLFLLCGNIYAQNPIIESNLVLIQSIMEDNFSPPVASRIHLYANIAAYEVYCHSQKTFKSISKKSHLPPIDAPHTAIDYDIAAVVAFHRSALKYIFTEDLIKQHLEAKKAAWYARPDTSLLSASIAYGEFVANKIIEWSKGDNYGYTRTLHRYELSDSLGAWKPTPPEYNNGLEPNWYLMRQIVLPKDSFIPYKPNATYKETKKSAFYQNALAVYLANKSLTESQKNIALYWDDNPMTTVSKGHVMYVVKKPTPIGHWLKIASQVLRAQKIDAPHSAQLYTMMSIAAYDAFINCWYVKYQTNSIRPETYIQRLIHPNYKPLIETPPFPEYTSGHSTVSSAAATVLTHFFPKLNGFTDSSQTFLQMKPHKFKSFFDAAKEASISRFYGGIHYIPALKEGERMGKIIGENAARLLE